ncbi:MAG: hypothetical protein U9Q82_10465, partial [Chloroflexota bacterium]|nr:hypothetical protein [Chloroflexota bacterium]
MWGYRLTVEPVKEHSHGAAAQCNVGLADGGEWWIHVTGNFKIINPDNGHVLGYSQADLVNGVYGVDSGAAITVLTKTRLR